MCKQVKEEPKSEYDKHQGNPEQPRAQTRISRGRADLGSFGDLLHENGFASGAVVNAIMRYHLLDIKFRSAFRAGRDWRALQLF
jgi:hypothetical protein